MSWLDELFFPPVDALKHLRVPIGKLPIERINYTWISMYRDCGRKALLSSWHEQVGSFHMFGGSVFHQALEEAILSPDVNHWLALTGDPRYWYSVYERVYAVHPEDNYGTFDTDMFAEKLAGKEALEGYNMGQLIYFALQLLKATGWKIEHVELQMTISKPGTIPWTGTADLVLRHRDIGLCIADTKTTGIWNKYFTGSSINKQSYDEAQVSNHTQLTHYDWLGWRSGVLDKVQQYMIFTPSNLSKYVKGANAGDFKGPPFHFGTPLSRSILRYEEDLQVWLRMAMEGYFPRMYPSMFGKLDCPRCPYGEHCLTDKSSERVPAYLQGRR